jgi:hypothetical protein
MSQTTKEVINPLNKQVMTKNDTKLVLQAFDELSDLLIDLMEDYYEDSFVWDGVSEARTHVLQGRERLATLFGRLLLEGDKLP